MSKLEQIFSYIDNPILKRAFLFLEEGDWLKANAYLEELLNENPENGLAYLGKLMIDTQVTTCTQLTDLANTFEDNINYQRCIRYVDSDISAELQSYNEYIKERNSMVTYASAYNKAVNLMNNATISKEFDEAAEKFKELGDYEDSPKLAAECLAKKADILYKYARTENNFKNAAKVYEQAAEYCDVKDNIENCYQKAEQIRIREEKEAKKRKRTFKFFSIFMIIGAILFGMYYAYVTFIKYTPMEQAKVGDLVKFGSYKGEEIAWQVLDVKNGKKLLITKDGIDGLQFDINGSDVWADSSLRNWLNNDFYNQAFAQGQRKYIDFVTTQEDVLDSVFLLTYDEVCKYFGKIEQRKCKSGTTVPKNFGICYWWLSSHKSGGIDYILANGELCAKGSVGTDWHVVRPAIWVDINSRNDKRHWHEWTTEGSIVKFGTYQGEKIEWLVLESGEGMTWLLSKYALDTKPYNVRRVKTTWENCTLRNWLNNDFLNVAFDVKEKKAIMWHTAWAEKNPTFNTYAGRDTKDKVSLLSISEVTRYLKNMEDRKCKATVFAKKNEAFVDNETGCSFWWLRSPGLGMHMAAQVLPGGGVFEFGTGVDFYNVVVRPAILVDLTKIFDWKEFVDM